VYGGCAKKTKYLLTLENKVAVQFKKKVWNVQK